MGIVLIFLLLCLSSTLGYKKCYKNGLCLGHLILVQENVNAMFECMDNCRNQRGCNFASFHSKAKTCTLSKGCNKIVLRDQPYQYSSIQCSRKFTYVNITPTLYI